MHICFLTVSFQLPLQLSALPCLQEPPCRVPRHNATQQAVQPSGGEAWSWGWTLSFFPLIPRMLDYLPTTCFEKKKKIPMCMQYFPPGFHSLPLGTSYGKTKQMVKYSFHKLMRYTYLYVIHKPPGRQIIE